MHNKCSEDDNQNLTLSKNSAAQNYQCKETQKEVE